MVGRGPRATSCITMSAWRRDPTRCRPSWQPSVDVAGVLVAWYCRAPASRLGDSLAVELPALDRAALVRIQVPQPRNSPMLINIRLTCLLAGCEPAPGWDHSVPESRSHRDRSHLAATLLSVESAASSVYQIYRRYSGTGRSSYSAP